MLRIAGQPPAAADSPTDLMVSRTSRSWSPRNPLNVVTLRSIYGPGPALPQVLPVFPAIQAGSAWKRAALPDRLLSQAEATSHSDLVHATPCMRL